MEERYYTFLVPIVFTYKGSSYYVWGYRTEDAEIVSFNATQNPNQNWTNPTCFDDTKLIEEFKKYLPDLPIKKKRRKTK